MAVRQRGYNFTSQRKTDIFIFFNHLGRLSEGRRKKVLRLNQATISTERLSKKSHHPKSECSIMFSGVAKNGGTQGGTSW